MCGTWTHCLGRMCMLPGTFLFPQQVVSQYERIVDTARYWLTKSMAVFG